MLGLLLAVALTIAMMCSLSATIWLLVADRSPMLAAWRHVAIGRVVRRESADLDAQYELLLRR